MTPSLGLLGLHDHPFTGQPTGLEVVGLEGRKGCAVQGLPLAGEGQAQHAVYGTLIPSAQRLGWAAKQPLGSAALGALFA